MSSKSAMRFGDEYQEKYAKILEKWENKIKDAGKVTAAMEEKWASDLEKELAELLLESLMSEEEIKGWNKLDLPSKETQHNFTKIGVKFALAVASGDLLRRYVKSVRETRDISPGESPVGGLKVYRPGEFIARASQTLAQIYDMATDKFNSVMNSFLKKKGEVTGRRKWVTVGGDSRHAALDGQIRGEGGTFTFNKKSIYGPRPADGNPNDWSGCSCYLTFERSDGTWTQGI